MNAERLVLGAEGVDVHCLADLGDGPSDVLGMRQDAVEVGAAESPSAEGALVDTFGEVVGVLPTCSLRSTCRALMCSSSSPLPTSLPDT